MNEPVNAPNGFEGCMWFDDGIREHRVAFRRAGDTWWTNCYLTAGHVHLVADERMRRAEQAITHALTTRGMMPAASAPCHHGMTGDCVQCDDENQPVPDAVLGWAVQP